MASREDLVDVFEDTRAWYETDVDLKAAVQASIRGTKLYMENDTPTIPEPKTERTGVTVTRHKTLEAALLLRQKYTDVKITVHNFASATRRVPQQAGNRRKSLRRSFAVIFAVFS